MIHKTKAPLNLIFEFIFLSLLLLLAHPHPAFADTSENNTSIFTGQFLPAFIGGAYDPSEAYKRIAGLPVYVFGYDRWTDTQAMVINNYAIRTEIRADGSFQVQGLPTAAHYAVYFPFEKSADISKGVTRTDCTAGDLNPCAGFASYANVPDAEFRMPEDQDLIKDVFSYAQGDATGVTIDNTQIPGQKITLGKVFLTNETRVDIQNHVNVFPLVPVTNIKITVYANRGDSFEVVAQRVSQSNCSANGCIPSGPLNYPVIRGRTIESGSFDIKLQKHVFQAYGPSGNYAISVWRTETNSATYKDWDLQLPVNSSTSGFAVQTVHKDWREILNDANGVAVNLNRITIWGTITNDLGYLMDGSSGTGIGGDTGSVLVNIKSDTGIRNTFVGQNGGGGGGDFYTPGTTGALPTRSAKGIYFISQTTDLANLSVGDKPPQSESPWLYVINEGSRNFKEAPKQPDKQFINGTDGPVRLNLVTSKGTHSSGYDNGIILRAGNGCLDDCAEYSNAVAKITANVQNTETVPALLKSYGANRLGIIYIPDVDLKRGQTYFIGVTAGNKYSYFTIDYPDNGAGSYAETSVALAEGPHGGSKPYMLLGIVPIPFLKDAIAAGNGQVKTSVELKVSSGTKLINTKVIITQRTVVNVLGGQCTAKDGCGIIQGSGLSNDLPPGVESGGSFELAVPQPDWDNARNECIARAPTGFLNTFCAQMLVSDRVTSNYEVKVTGTAVDKDGNQTPVEASHSFQVDSKNPTILPFALSLGFSCDASFPTDILNVGKTINNLPAQYACKIGLWMGDKLDSLFNFVQKNGFQMRPITSERGIVMIWNVIRGFANILFILLLIFIGITTILRIDPKNYNLGVLIPKLFINIALANFSLLLVQFLIDISNILTQTFFLLIEGVLQNTGSSAGSHVLAGSTAIAGTAIAATLSITLAGIIIGAVVLAVATGGTALIPILGFIVTMGFSFIVLAIGLMMIFLIRYVAVWIATVLAPLFFVASTFPSKTLSGLTQLFWNTILPFIFMGPAMAFVMGMGILLISVGGDENGILFGFGSAIAGIITLVATLSIPGMLGGMFKGGLAAPGSITGKGSLVEGLSKRKDDFSKNLDSGKMAGYAARGRAQYGGALGGIRGMALGLRGEYAKEDAQLKELKSAAEAGLGRTPGARRAALEKEMGEARSAGVDMGEYKTLSNYFKNASRTDAKQGVYTGAKDATTGDMIQTNLGNFLSGNGLVDAKGEVKVVDAIKQFKSIAPKGTTDPDQIEARNLNNQVAKRFARSIKTD